MCSGWAPTTRTPIYLRYRQSAPISRPHRLTSLQLRQNRVFQGYFLEQRRLRPRTRPRRQPQWPLERRRGWLLRTPSTRRRPCRSAAQFSTEDSVNSSSVTFRSWSIQPWLICLPMLNPHTDRTHYHFCHYPMVKPIRIWSANRTSFLTPARSLHRERTPIKEVARRCPLISLRLHRNWALARSEERRGG